MDMTEKKPGREYTVQVAARIRAIMEGFGIRSNPEMADVCGTTTSVVNNWRLAYNLPPVHNMIILCERTGLTLDWIYRGSVHTMDPKKAFALSKLADRITVN